MFDDDAELRALRSMIRDQIRAGVEFACGTAFFIAMLFLWVGTP